MRASVAVVGGRGYLGSHIGEALAQGGHDVWIVGRQPASAAIGSALPYRSSVPELAAAIQGANCVVHVASVTTPAIGERNPYLELDNIRFTLDLVRACEKQRVEHLVFASSGGALYGDTGGAPAEETSPARPSCFYAVAKFTCEEFMRAHAADGRVPATVLRISNVYGGRQVTKGDQGFVSYALRRALADEAICLYGDTIRDYICLDDVVSAFVSAVDSGPAGFRLCNVSTGVGTSLSGIVSMLQDALGRQLRTTRVERRAFDLQTSVLANGLAMRVLNWKPLIELSRGLRRAVQEQPRSGRAT